MLSVALGETKGGRCGGDAHPLGREEATSDLEADDDGVLIMNFRIPN